MSDIPKYWAELTEIYSHVERYPEDGYREDIIERIEGLEESIADAAADTFEDVAIKLRVLIRQIKNEDSVAAPSSLQYRLAHSAAHAIAPAGLY
jgi:hypothetical protein